MKKNSNNAHTPPPPDEVFSDYVAWLAGGSEPLREDYEAVREGLRGILVGEMRRRGLWNVPPAFLGCSGSTWSEGGLDELVTDVYSFIFVERLKGLINQQRLKPNIRPMVVLNVRHFLTEGHKTADPLGYRLFGRLRDAVVLEIDGGRLFALNLKSASAPVRNGTVLAFANRSAALLTPRADLAEIMRRWNDELLPKLLTAEGPAVPALVERLAELIRGLREEGVRGFRFGDLIGELKKDARARWRAIWVDSLDLRPQFDEEDGPLRVPFVDPEQEDLLWADLQLFIQDCVEMGIEREKASKSRQDLRELWLWLRTQRMEIDEFGALPKLAELGRCVGLNRDRVRQLFELLRPIVEACLKAAERR